VPHIELDEVFWAEGWQFREDADVQQRLDALLSGPAIKGWVACGNWNNRLSALGDPFGDADAIVWLDFPRRVIMPRVIRRTLARGLTRRDIWHGNRERLTNLFKRNPEENIVRWSWTEHDTNQKRYRALAEVDSRVIQLRTPREATRWLTSRGGAA